MRLGDVGEFGLIDQIRSAVSAQSDRVVLGIGDDAAAVRMSDGLVSLLTTDTLVEGVHFRRATTSMTSLGWKTLAVNLSDIAAMGGLPRCAVVSLALSDTWSTDAVRDLYTGLSRCSERFNCPIVGGDTVRSPEHGVITMTVLGQVEEGCLVMRSGAQEGDLLCVSGDLGNARTGLEILEPDVDSHGFTTAVQHFLEPEPRLALGRWLAATVRVTAMIDISDGLASEVGHLCSESKLGAILDAAAIPVADEARCWSESRGKNPIDLALESGEEYALLFTVPEGRLAHWLSNKPPELSDITVIGSMRPETEGILLHTESGEIPLEARGWNHFDA